LADEGLITGRRGGGTIVRESTLSSKENPLRSAILINQIEALLLSLLSQGYSEAQVEAAFASALSGWHTLRQKSGAANREGQTKELRFVGSNDLTVEYLAASLKSSSDFELKTSYQGSLGGLMALARDEADIAGSHLWDEKNNVFNEPFVRRVLPGQKMALVNVANRSFGLILPPGNPQHINSLNDLTRNGVVWVNRQPGSGTRVWLDAELKRLCVDTAEIVGYDDVKATHMEVAQAIVQGTATAGLGIQAAAEVKNLEFIPYAEETYQLVIPETVVTTDACQYLLQVLQADEFKKTIESFGGYRTDHTGELIWVE
jgi:putative molybdopterin biosynthesis protein